VRADACVGVGEGGEAARPPASLWWSPPSASPPRRRRGRGSPGVGRLARCGGRKERERVGEVRLDIYRVAGEFRPSDRGVRYRAGR
jgi:hypothetical protein